MNNMPHAGRGPPPWEGQPRWSPPRRSSTSRACGARLPVRARLETDPAAARELLRQLLRQLLRIDRYERSAPARRKLALRAFDAALPPAGKTAGGKIPEQSQLG